jgi:hypothetical protein
MTEQEWQTCTDPQKMLGFLANTQSDRKLRLFAVECCSRLLPFITDPHSRKALRMAERFADGRASSEKLRFAWQSARRAAQTNRRRSQDATGQDDALWAVTLVVEQDFSRLKWLGGWVNRVMSRVKEAGLPGLPAFDEMQTLRCIFGNPFRSLAIDSAWLAWNGGTIPKIAEAIYDEKAFDRFPVLADALEEAGCDNAEFLAHLREPGPHVRGCWVVDLLLGKG